MLQTTDAVQMNNGESQTFRSECPTDLSKPYLPLDIFFKIKSKSLSKMQKQVDSSSDDDGDDENDDKQFADDKLTIPRDTILAGEKLPAPILDGEIGQDDDIKNKELNEENEEGEEDKPHKEDDQPQYHPRKKRKRKRKKTRKKAANPPQPQDQVEKTTMSSETCTMTTTRTKNAVPTSRPISLPLSLSLPLPLRPMSISPLRDGPLRDGPAKATTPEGMRSLHALSTLCVINENEAIDAEPSTFDEVDANLPNDTQDNSETIESTLSNLSAILNSNHDRNGNQNINNCNNNIKFNNDNNNNRNTNDNNNNKNNHFKVIISDYDDEINGDFNLRENSFEFDDSSDRHLEYTNEQSNNSWLSESSSFSSLYRLESLEDSYFNDGSESPGLEGVKAMANRLKLATRRPSYQQWCDRYIGSSGVPKFPDLSPEEEVDEKLTEERKDRINSALEWIKNELGQMRTVDHNLATQLLTLRNGIHRLKLERSCENHQDLLDDVKDELTERETLSAVSDIPYDMADDNPLKHLGVTRMNISSRRFSMC